MPLAFLIITKEFWSIGWALFHLVVNLGELIRMTWMPNLFSLYFWEGPAGIYINLQGMYVQAPFIAFLLWLLLCIVLISLLMNSGSRNGERHIIIFTIIVLLCHYLNVYSASGTFACLSILIFKINEWQTSYLSGSFILCHSSIPINSREWGRFFRQERTPWQIMIKLQAMPVD